MGNIEQTTNSGVDPRTSRLKIISLIYSKLTQLELKSKTSVFSSTNQATRPHTLSGLSKEFFILFSTTNCRCNKCMSQPTLLDTNW